MIRVQLTENQRQELEKYRGQSSSNNSEKAFMVLLNSEGKSAVNIGKQLRRNPHTVRSWLKRYIQHGLLGLERNYSEGRPREKRDKCIRIMEEILPQSPQKYGYLDLVWSIPLILHHLKTACQIDTGKHTVIRGLNDLGYSYKRPSKTVSPKAPSSEEKKEAVKTMIESMEKLLTQKPCEIFVLDESHFSTEPYLVRGWFKKRWPPQDPEFHQKRKLHHVWMLKFKEASFLLETIQAS